MTQFTQHTLESAPEASRPLLENAKKAYGRIPGLTAVMAESPALLEGYMKVSELFQGASLNKDEFTVIWQTINVENECHYCVPAHTAIAQAMKVDDAITQALRDETLLPTPRLEALRTFTLLVVRDRGFVGDAAVQAFLDAGFTRQNVLDVILGLAQKVMSNYTNHLAKTPIDAAFAKYEWTRKADAAAPSSALQQAR